MARELRVINNPKPRQPKPEWLKIRLGDPTTGKDVTSQLTGGRLGALIELRDQNLPRFQSQLDEFSQTISDGSILGGKSSIS